MSAYYVQATGCGEASDASPSSTWVLTEKRDGKIELFSSRLALVLFFYLVPYCGLKGRATTHIGRPGNTGSSWSGSHRCAPIMRINRLRHCSCVFVVVSYRNKFEKSYGRLDAITISQHQPSGDLVSLRPDNCLVSLHSAELGFELCL